MKGIPIMHQNPTINNETRLNIEDAEENKCYPKKNVGSGMLLPKLSFP